MKHSKLIVKATIATIKNVSLSGAHIQTVLKTSGIISEKYYKVKS
jgi:hypothetical protein